MSSSRSPRLSREEMRRHLIDVGMVYGMMLLGTDDDELIPDPSVFFNRDAALRHINLLRDRLNLPRIENLGAAPDPSPAPAPLPGTSSNPRPFPRSRPVPRPDPRLSSEDDSSDEREEPTFEASGAPPRKRMKKDGPDSRTSEDLCSICLDTLEPDRKEQLNHCSHSFHQSCIKQWKEKSTRCPICRARMS